MSNPPLYDEQDGGDGENDAFGGLIDFGRSQRRMRGFSRFGDAAQDAMAVQWTTDYKRYLADGIDGATAKMLADNANPFYQGTNSAISAALAKGIADKAAQTQQQIQTGTQIGTQAAQAGTQLAVQYTTQRSGASAVATPGGTTSGGAGATASNTSGGARPASSTAMYAGAAAVALGLAFFMSKKSRGSLGGYSRRRKTSRKSRSRKSRR